MAEEETLAPHEIMEGVEFGTDGPAQTIEDFPDRVQENVEGLMFLGYLQKDFDFCGHHFVIRTLKGDEELLASLVCKEFVGTMGQERSWIWALVGMSLTSVAGDSNFFPPISKDKRAYARARFQYVTRKGYWPPAAHPNPHLAFK